MVAGLCSACPGDKGGGDTGTLDADADGFDVDLDCDDDDPAVNPDAVEICGDGVDNDCDGVDDPCGVDADLDGYLVDDDCDDHNELANPGMTEDCSSGFDDNCDGINSQCLYPELIYAPTSAPPFDSYGVGVFADYVVFGDPGGGVAALDDGRVVFFELDPGTVSELDATVVSNGELGAEGAYGTVITPVGGNLCIGADYRAYDLATVDAGRSWCYSETTVRAAVGTLDLAAASYTATGEQAFGYATVEGQADVDGDGIDDLLVYTSLGVHVVLGDGSSWSGDYDVPSGADYTLGNCAGSMSGWCGFGRALGTNPPTLAVSEEGAVPDTVSLFTLPLPGGSTVPGATAPVLRNASDSATAVETVGAFVFGDSSMGAVEFIDAGGASLGNAFGDPSGGFGFWASAFIDARGHELLLISDPFAQSPAGLTTGVGVVYVFDVTDHGLPESWERAVQVLMPPDTYFSCGWRARGGVVTDDTGRYSTVAVSCPSSGGAAYRLDEVPLPAPPIPPQHLFANGPGEYVVKQWVADAYMGNADWMLGLAQTEAVHNAAGSPTGWRLHGIGTGTPLFRAGLRDGDVLRRVNGIAVTTPAVVDALVSSLHDAGELTIGFTRSGVNRSNHYTFVP